jgi:hypothetical protein
MHLKFVDTQFHPSDMWDPRLEMTILPLHMCLLQPWTCSEPAHASPVLRLLHGGGLQSEQQEPPDGEEPLCPPPPPSFPLD